MNALSHAQVQDLLGAYALDAVDADEAEAIDLHLRDCPRCRAEVTTHRETAAFLAAGHSPAPPAVWAGIVAGLEDASPPPLDMNRFRRQRSGRSLPVLLQTAAAIAAAVLVVALGVRVADQGRTIDRLQNAVQSRTLMSQALAASAGPAARRADLRSPDGVALAHAVVTPDGTGYLWVDRLSTAASGRTYQLWAVVGDQAISAGVLGMAPEIVAFSAAGPVTGLAITEEVAGGVVRSANPPLATGPLAS